MTVENVSCNRNGLTEIVQLETQEIMENNGTAADENGSDASIQEINGNGSNNGGLMNDAIDVSDKFEIMDERLPHLPFTSNRDESDTMLTPRKCQNRKKRPPSVETKNKAKHLKCKECEYATYYISNLKRHQHVHVREKSMGVARDSSELYQCSHCIRQFAQLSHLSSHKKSHKDNNQFFYYCTRCMRRFVQTNDKDKHETKCDGHYFECYLCKIYVASRKNLMQDHMRTHTGAKPFRCPVCSKLFNIKGNLKHHLNTIHSRFKC